MGIGIVRYEKEGIHWGVLDGGQIYPVQASEETLAAFLAADGKQRAEEAREHAQPFSQLEVTLLSPVTLPGQIVCQGANYSAHREEGGLDAKRPPFNMIFTKAPSSVTGPEHDIESPKSIELLDYEIELGLVFHKALTGPVADGEAALKHYVAGFVIGNDVSSRDLQFTENQWFKGKSLRTFCPVGPVLYLIDPEEAPLVHDLELTLKVNGEVRQQANTSQLLYKPEETLVELSGMMDFQPGDLLLTGTPGGVALKLQADEMNALLNPFEKLDKKVKMLNESQKDNPNYLKEGDVITCEIRTADGKIDLGRQENTVRFV
ncbi:fumarylacetoacetate hydrolase family protein [Alkalicoccus urumqiensis]|uniref:2-keto-4-pentenoate hydratase n=1 Tax=Alkalicoccus urumqiensis TaxID=1548213 RepID=A0A2P6MLU7_ALKUR|nr:fumarylacetoacetate hydrolase family protein [Alkalicoccus urumqiensis]PRO67241.1 2-keto-4-pentenoate hydratase [Alkalicoccus urumqiensis]